jgi:DNA polymerase III delta prime subunit
MDEQEHRMIVVRKRKMQKLAGFLCRSPLMRMIIPKRATTHETSIYGNVQGLVQGDHNVISIRYDHTPKPPLSKQGHQNRQRMLTKVYACWVKGVLEKSVDDAALIALGLHEQRDAITNPWRLVLEQQDLPSGTRITQVYDDGGGELLILGEPGSGKTTLLLELTRDLLERAKNDDTHPIPVVFNLSSWALKRQALTKWLVEELHAKYQVPRKLGQSWVDGDHIQPLLDGLDEVPVNYREACVDAINDFRQERGLVPFVVCSRSAAYMSQKKRVSLQRAVTVRPLTREQINEYLSSAEDKLTSIQNALHEDKVLQKLVTTPLMLSVITLAYQGIAVENYATADTIAVRRQQIFAIYVNQMLRRREGGGHYTQLQSLHWLAWLAQQMAQKNQAEFHIERMQIDWFSDHPFYQLLLSTSTGLLIAFFGWIVYSIFFWNKFGLVGVFTDAVSVSLFFTIIYVLVNSVILPLLERQKQIIQAKSGKVKMRSWRSALHFLTSMLDTRWGYGLLIGVPVGSLIGFIMGQAFGIIAGLAYGLINVLMITLEFSAFDKFSIEIKPVENVVWSWTSVWRNLRKSVLSSLGFALLMGTLFIIDHDFDLKRGILAGLLYGVGYFITSNLMHWGASHEVLKKNESDKPNQGIRRSTKNCLFFGTVTMCLSGLFFWLIHSLFGRPMEGIYYGALAGVIFGGIMALRGGGFACFQHYFVRILLLCAGYIPWNYVRFLDYAAEQILLRKVGGGYIFIHRMLLEHFASLYQSSPPES